MSQEYKDYADLLFQLLIVIAALLALRQISLTRQVAKVTATREAVRLSAEQCRYYGEKIIPLINDLNDAIRTSNMRFLSESSVEIEGSSIKVVPFTDYPGFSTSLDGLDTTFAPVYNALNAFSLYFVSGVGDERSAFATVGTTFCETVKTIAPIVVAWSRTTREENILRLYVLWRTRMEHEENVRELSQVQDKLARTRSVEIKPMGT